MASPGYHRSNPKATTNYHPAVKLMTTTEKGRRVVPRTTSTSIYSNSTSLERRGSYPNLATFQTRQTSPRSWKSRDGIFSVSSSWGLEHVSSGRFSKDRTGCCDGGTPSMTMSSRYYFRRSVSPAFPSFATTRLWQAILSSTGFTIRSGRSTIGLTLRLV